MNISSGTTLESSDVFFTPLSLRLYTSLLHFRKPRRRRLDSAKSSMASQASPLASLTQTLPEPIQVRPAVPVRTASSRTIPGNSRSTLPRIHLAIPSDALPDDVQQGVREIAREAVRENVRVVEGGAGQLSGQGSWVWTIRCVPSSFRFRSQADCAVCVAASRSATTCGQERW